MSDAPAPAPVGERKCLNSRQRRIMGVLIEKARTTATSYPLSLNALVLGCNQKSNRHPLMNLTEEQVADELIAMRELGAVAEVHGNGRVPKYRHYCQDFLGVTGNEAGVLTELLLRGEQTLGDLRARASRFGAIADQGTLQTILKSLMEKNLVIAVTPPGRGQLVTHNLYENYEQPQKHDGGLSDGDAAAFDEDAAAPATAAPVQVNSHVPATTPDPTRTSLGPTTSPAPTASVPAGPSAEDFEMLQLEIEDLKLLVERLSDRIDRLEG